MDKVFDASGMKDFWTQGIEVATRWQEIGRTACEAQMAAAQKATVEAVNRSFDTTRELVKMADEATRGAAEQARKAWPVAA
ncbi:MAG: hypothetical protein FJ087_18145 [Deltaproteobacteria bacterium]|nr:hypothetical protein [Deltaproteobacteria bacterium]